MISSDVSTAWPPVSRALVGSEALSGVQPVAYPLHAILFREGDVDDQIYVVLAGRIAVLQGLGTADEQVIALRVSGEFIGERSFFDPTRHHQFSGRAEADSLVLKLNRCQVDAAVQRDPLLSYELLGIASTILQWSHEHAMRELQVKNEQLAAAYAALEAAQTALLRQERLRHELQLAREIQEGMLPTVLPQVDGLDLCVRSVPAFEVGGDFFDVFVLDSETLGVVIGDVCGKGMPAALYMAQTRSLLRAEARRSASPEKVLRRVNRHLLALNTGDMFVTVLYGRLHHATGTFDTARAGHEYPVVWGPDRTERPGERSVGQPLGILRKPELDLQRRTLQPGETLVLYTDGITDTVNPAGDMFALDGLHRALQTAPALTAEVVCSCIVANAVSFQQTAQQLDDMTLVVVHVD